MKKYKIGMYGGKFMPFHKGHKYCLDVASSQCEIVYAIMYTGCSDEKRILKEMPEEYLTFEERMKNLERICNEYDNVKAFYVDVSGCYDENGVEDWDAETPLLREIFGNKLDAVFSSELGYVEYFKTNFPEADHILVDPPRKVYPISGTKFRNFDTDEERKKWLVE